MISHPQHHSDLIDSPFDQAPILLADDNFDDVELMRLAFSKAGFQNPIQYLQSGRDTIDYLKQSDYKGETHSFPLLLLLDLNMPEISGLEVLSWIRAQEELQLLPVVIITHSDRGTDISQAFQQGANAYWVKPSSFESLLEMMIQLKNRVSNVERGLAV